MPKKNSPIDNEYPQKEIKIRIRWTDYQEIKKLLKNEIITILSNKAVRKMTKFARESTLREFMRQKNKIQMRKKGKGRIDGA